MPNAEIITIGTEILLGEIIDTNARYIARQLRDNGIDIYRTSSVGDNLNRIAEIIQESQKRADLIITTGGLGPTVDDPTRGAVAKAFGVELQFHESLWEEICAIYSRFRRTPSENNRRQAYIPAGALAVSNPVGTAPAFIMETPKGAVISLPGVPQEMEVLLENAILPYLRQRFNLESVLQVRVLHTSGAGESQIDSLIEDLETLDNPTVGLAAHTGQVDVRITAKAATHEEAAQLIEPVEMQLRERLGKWIYGADEDTLGATVLNILAQRGWALGLVEAGLGGFLISTLTQDAKKFPEAGRWLHLGEAFPFGPTSSESFQESVQGIRKTRNVDAWIGVALSQHENKIKVLIYCATPAGEKTLEYDHPGAASQAARRAVNNALDLMKRMLDS